MDYLTDAAPAANKNFSPTAINGTQQVSTAAVLKEAESLLVEKPSPFNQLNALGLTWAELRKAKFPPIEFIVHGLLRKEVGLVFAVTNAGKSTLLRQAAVRLAVGRRFEPLTLDERRRKVAVLDFEDQLSRIRADIDRMITAGRFSEEQLEAIDRNLLIIAEYHDETGVSLSLSNPVHMERVMRRCNDFGADLIILDTIGASFRIFNESDNAEIRSSVMVPLRELAIETNAAVLAAHHIGKAKAEGGLVRESSHRGRGASSFADLARLIINLEKDHIDDTILLHNAKVKGERFDDTKLRINPETRWLELLGKAEPNQKYKQVLELFEDNRERPTRDVVAAFKGDVAPRTIRDILKRANEAGDLTKVRHGIWVNNETAKRQIV